MDIKDLKNYEIRKSPRRYMDSMKQRNDMCKRCGAIAIFSSEGKEISDKNEFGDKLCEQCLMVVRITAKEFPISRKIN